MANFLPPLPDLPGFATPAGGERAASGGESGGVPAGGSAPSLPPSALVARAGGSTSVRRPIEALAHALAVRERQRRTLWWHPRTDRLWVTRIDQTYRMSLHRGAQEYVLAPEAVAGLAAHLDVSATLLTRLALTPKAEDCRLLNLLLWDLGARPDAKLQCVVDRQTVVAIRSSQYAAVDLAALVGELAAAEAQGTARLRRYDLTETTAWLEVEHADMIPLPSPSAAPSSDTAGGADLWRPGCVVVNQEDAARALQIVPVLFRAWGHLILPVMAQRTALRVRHHRHGRSATVLRARLLSDVATTRSAPFATALERLWQGTRRPVPPAQVRAYLVGLEVDLPSPAVTDAIVGFVLAGRASHFRVVVGALRAARDISAPLRRVRYLAAWGRHVWQQRPGRPTGRSVDTTIPPRAVSEVPAGAGSRPLPSSVPVARTAAPPIDISAFPPPAPVAVPVHGPSSEAMVAHLGAPPSRAGLRPEHYAPTAFHIPKATQRPAPNTSARRRLLKPPPPVGGGGASPAS